MILLRNSAISGSKVSVTPLSTLRLSLTQPQTSWGAASQGSQLAFRPNTQNKPPKRKQPPLYRSKGPKHTGLQLYELYLCRCCVRIKTQDPHAENQISRNLAAVATNTVPSSSDLHTFRNRGPPPKIQARLSSNVLTIPTKPTAPPSSSTTDCPNSQPSRVQFM